MSDQNTYQITALGVPYAVRRVYLNTEKRFTEPDLPYPDLRLPSTSAKKSDTYRRPILIPTSPFEVETMDCEDAHEDASEVTDTHWLVVDELRVGKAETVKDLQTKALKRFEGSEFAELTVNQKYHRYSLERFGKGHSALIKEKRDEVVARFRSAFEEIQYVTVTHSWRPSSEAEVVMGYEIFAKPSVVRTMVDLAGCGHVQSQYLAALLLCFAHRGLTGKCVELLLKAHENKHPQALDALARLLLAQRDYVGAVQCALLAMEGQYRHAKLTIEFVQRALTGMVMETPRGLVPAFLALLAELESGFGKLASKHFPEWYPSEDDLARAFFQRFMGGSDRV
ncbi:hypothetical protein [Burkholderia lata]|uniref:Uncharacterized protein n=1 Tax=Burkholderia lata (strain ATCC 17760 / DSM 23089 / LMG 22485 / NCIMB 9086 / R18194 / 383) TaxID=482957 RepID=A0A6P2JP34_BURL3|nr:hypothetical protein [Burkholderia lata]VWB43135.1 hypothetical protein BLA6863_01929 [Burkholderia lata]